MGMVHGEVAVLGISNLLQSLVANRREGYLTLREGDRKKVLHLSARGIRLVSGARRANPLGEILIRVGQLGRDELRRLLAEQRLTRRPLGELIVRRGLMKQKQLDEALRDQAAEEIYEVFDWQNATFGFIEADEVRAPANEGPLSAIVLEGNLMSVLLEAARRADELAEVRKVLPDPDASLERRRGALPVKAPDLDQGATREAILLTDGRRTVEQILEASVYPRFVLLRTLRELVVRGVMEVRAKAG